MHARTSGLADYYATDEQDAIRIGRRIVARLNWRKQGPGRMPAIEPRYEARTCWGSCRGICGSRSILGK